MAKKVSLQITFCRIVVLIDISNPSVFHLKTGKKYLSYIPFKSTCKNTTKDHVIFSWKYCWFSPCDTFLFLWQKIFSEFFEKMSNFFSMKLNVKNFANFFQSISLKKKFDIFFAKFEKIFFCDKKKGGELNNLPCKIRHGLGRLQKSFENTIFLIDMQ